MKEKDILLVAVAAVLLRVSVVNAAFTTTPQNVVVDISGSATFSCTTTNAAVIGWKLTRDGDTAEEIIVSTNCVVPIGYTDHYSTTNENQAKTCNLHVFNVALRHAGVYICLEGLLENEAASALMTVVEHPVIDTNETVAMAGVTLNISCSMVYNGSVSPAPLMPPSLNWTSSNGEQFSTSNPSTQPPNSIQSFLLFVPDKSLDTAGPFTCRASFQISGSIPPFYASNIPTNTYAVNSSIFSIRYNFPPTITSEVYIEPDNVCEARRLQCHSDANPPADTVQWIDLLRQETFVSDRILAEQGGSYSCVVLNSIEGREYSASTVYSVPNDFTITPCRKPKNVNLTGENCVDEMCYCNNGSWSILSCSGEAFPEPSFRWTDGAAPECWLDQNANTINVTSNATYVCTVTNSFDGTQFKVSTNITVTGCLESDMPWICDSSSGSCGLCCPDGPACIAVLSVLGFLLLNQIALVFFLIYYAEKSDNNGCCNGHEKLNNCFPWLIKMLPCMNGKCQCSGWVFLFVVADVFVGIVFFPTLVIIANCSCCQKSQQNSPNNQSQPIGSNVNGNTLKDSTTPGIHFLSSSDFSTAPPTPPPPLGSTTPTSDWVDAYFHQAFQDNETSDIIENNFQPYSPLGRYQAPAEPHYSTLENFANYPARSRKPVQLFEDENRVVFTNRSEV